MWEPLFHVTSDRRLAGPCFCGSSDPHPRCSSVAPEHRRGEIGLKGKAYLLRGCLIFLAFGYGEITVSYHAELGLPLTILILCLLIWFIAWQAQRLAKRLKAIDREQEELLSAGELKLIPLRPAQKVVNVVLIVWGSLCILGTIIALVMKFG